LTNCSLVFSLQQGFDHEQVEEVGLLAIRLVIGLVARAFFQLELLSARTILGLGTGKTVWSGYIVQDGDLRDNWSL